jgi:pilus assembly protein CpaF
MNAEEHANFLAPLEPLLSDPEVAEVMVDGYDKVYVEKHGQLIDMPSLFRDDEHLMEVINGILEWTGQKADESNPFADVRLSDGSRVNAIVPPISLIGPVLTIRKFRVRRLSVEDVIRFGAVSEDLIEFLQACVQARFNIAIAGGVGSGKTTFLNIVAGMIPPDERIITVENAGELRLPETLKRVIRLESRPPNLEGRGEVTVRDLVINALRMRPDRIVVGEVRSSETFDLLQAMNTGHDGTAFTIHASSPRDALARLEMQVTYADLSVPLLSIRQMMASAIDLITYQERMPDGTRKVLKVTEVTGMQGDIIELQDIFEFRQTGVEDGRIRGHFTATGRIPGFLNRIQTAGIELPLSLFTPK